MRIVNPEQISSRSVGIAVLAALGLVAVTAGCFPGDGVDTAYGQRLGAGAKSVAGTSVLSEMFRAAGCQVSSDTKLSPRIDQFEVILWFPDDFGPPAEPAVGHLRQWLSKGGRTLVYVGRDFDAVSTYWRAARSQAPPDQAAEVARRLALAESEFAARRNSVAKAESTWFKQLPNPSPVRVSELTGWWSSGVDVTRTNLVVGHQLAAYFIDESKLREGGIQNGRIVLRGDQAPLVTELDVSNTYDSRILLVANGSFLLNLPLANIEHRKLAGRLINRCGPGARVLFLTSEPGGPDYQADSQAARVSPYQWLTTWPIGTILMHLFCAGIVVCAWLFPIFGRPRELPVEPRADFGKHVESLGNLLAKTEDADFAQAQVQHYQQIVRPEGPRSATGRSLGDRRRHDRRRQDT